LHLPGGRGSGVRWLLTCIELAAIIALVLWGIQEVQACERFAHGERLSFLSSFR
jgi:hypothetical protein